MKESINNRNSKIRKRKRFRIILIGISVIIFSFLCYGGYILIKTKNAFSNAHVDINRKENKSLLRDETVTLGKDPISILLLGVENYSTNGENGRADTQIVITLNPNTNEMSMVTIPRDTRVNIENAEEYSGIHKINAAYTYGAITEYGAIKLQVETVEKLLNVPIDKFVSVDFDGFRDIVDALGGIDINIKKEFWEKNIYKDNKKIHFKQGNAHLNGEEALAFVRMRKRAVNASYSRDERQRQFLEATVTQAISAGTIFKIGQIADILGNNVETDLTAEEIYSLKKQYSKLKNSSIKTIEIKGQDTRVNGGSYYIPEKESLEKVSQKLRETLGLKDIVKFKTNADYSEN